MLKISFCLLGLICVYVANAITEKDKKVNRGVKSVDSIFVFENENRALT